MFGSLAFVVNGKMCVTAGPGRIMCRIHPELHDQEVKKDGCSTVVMRGREYKGYIYIRESCLKTESDLMYWINLSLEFNGQLTSGRTTEYRRQNDPGSFPHWKPFKSP